MPFNTLFLECLTTKTTINEGKVKITVESPNNGEILLIFDTKAQNNIGSNLRKALDMNREAEPLCDSIIYYQSGQEMVVCFVELKGGEIDKAIKQVVNTREHFEAVLRSSGYDQKCNEIKWKAHIQSNAARGAPQDIKSKISQLEKIFKGGSQIDTKQNCNITDLLRGNKNIGKAGRK